MLLPKHREMEIEAMIEEIMTTYQAAGLALAVVDAQSTCYQRFWGYRDVAEQKPIDGDTIFGLASITKSFTALAIMQLVERGVLSLQEPLSTYLPDFHYPGQGVVTLAHFLSHCAGYAPLPRILASSLLQELELPDGEIKDPALSPTFAAEAGRRLIARLNNPPYPLLGRPGEYLSYCNDGFATLSEVVRLHGGYPTYAEYVKAEILEPLGMSRSRYDALSLAEEENRNTLYFPRNGERQSGNDWNLNAFALMGGGSLKSTLHDMEKYLRFYLNHGKAGTGKQVLSHYNIAEMQKPRIRHSHLRYYGYGMNTTTLDDITICGHGGSLPGVSSDMLWSHELGLGVIILCNTSDVPVAKIGIAIMKALNGHSANEPRIPFRDRPWDAATCAAAVGQYVSGEGGRFRIQLDEQGQPEIKIGGEIHKIRMVLPDLGLVQIKMNSAEVRLYRNEQGEVWAIGQGGRVVLRGEDI